MRRFEVYVLRRTSSRTVYAIYDNDQRRQFYAEGKPFTTTDRAHASSVASQLNAVRS